MEFLFSLEGRFNQFQWWIAQTINFALSTILVIWFFLPVLAPTFGFEFNPSYALQGLLGHGFGQVIIMLFIIAIIGGLIGWISIAATVKRFHDRDKNGSWIFIGCLPYIGAPWILIECGFLPGTPGPNQYGSSNNGNGPSNPSSMNNPPQENILQRSSRVNASNKPKPMFGA